MEGDVPELGEREGVVGVLSRSIREDQETAEGSYPVVATEPASAGGATGWAEPKLERRELVGQ